MDSHEKGIAIEKKSRPNPTGQALLFYLLALNALPLRRKEAPRIRAYFNTFATYRHIAAEPSFRAFPRRVPALFRVKKSLAGHAFFPKPPRNRAAGAGIPASATIAAS